MIVAVVKNFMMKRKLSKLAGSWKMSDKEAEAMLKKLRKGWSNWKIRYS